MNPESKLVNYHTVIRQDIDRSSNARLKVELATENAPDIASHYAIKAAITLWYFNNPNATDEQLEKQVELWYSREEEAKAMGYLPIGVEIEWPLGIKQDMGINMVYENLFLRENLYDLPKSEEDEVRTPPSYSYETQKAIIDELLLSGVYPRILTEPSIDLFKQISSKGLSLHANIGVPGKFKLKDDHLLYVMARAFTSLPRMQYRSSPDLVRHEANVHNSQQFNVARRVHLNIGELNNLTGEALHIYQKTITALAVFPNSEAAYVALIASNKLEMIYSGIRLTKVDNLTERGKKHFLRYFYTRHDVLQIAEDYVNQMYQATFDEPQTSS
jgi:hypothetical protein